MTSRRDPPERDTVSAAIRLQPVLELPDANTFTPDEWLAARVMIGMARSGGTMIQGRVLECRIARLLDAEFPRLGTSTWDLRLRDGGALIEVRSGTRAFSLVGSKQVDVWIFVAKVSLDSPAYFVAKPTEVAALRRAGCRTVSVPRAHSAFRLVAEADLRATVRAMARGRPLLRP